MRDVMPWPYLYITLAGGWTYTNNGENMNVYKYLTTSKQNIASFTFRSS